MKKEMIELRLLKKLIKHRIWGGVHIEERNLLKSLPKHMIGFKETKDAVKELVQLGFLVKQKKTHEDHYSLNSELEDEIYAYVENLQKSITII